MSAPPTPPLFTIPRPLQPTRIPRWAVAGGLPCRCVLSGAAILLVAFGPSAAEVPTLTGSAVIGFRLFGAVCGWLLSRISDFGTVAPSARWLALCWGVRGDRVPASRQPRDSRPLRGTGRRRVLVAADAVHRGTGETAGIFVVLLLAATRPRSALDGLVVGSFVGLGFEVVENIARSINNAITSHPPGQRDNLGSLTVDLSTRWFEEVERASSSSPASPVSVSDTR